MAGRVTRLNVEGGETAIMGTLNKDAATLLTISDMSVLETKVKVDETDVARITIGDSALVQIDAFPDTTFIGRVTKISNSSVKSATATQASGDQAVDYEVTIQLLNVPPETRPDFSATAKIVTDSRRNVLSIPIIALTVRENETRAVRRHGDRTGQAEAEEGSRQEGRRGRVRRRQRQQSDLPARKDEGSPARSTSRCSAGLKESEKIVAGTYQAIRELKDGALVKETKPDAKKPGA